jgi:hypothetical protein
MITSRGHRVSVRRGWTPGTTHLGDARPPTPEGSSREQRPQGIFLLRPRLEGAAQLTVSPVARKRIGVGGIAALSASRRVTLWCPTGPQRRACRYRLRSVLPPASMPSRLAQRCFGVLKELRAKLASKASPQTTKVGPAGSTGFRPGWGNGEYIKRCHRFNPFSGLSPQPLPHFPT